MTTPNASSRTSATTTSSNSTGSSSSSSSSIKQRIIQMIILVTRLLLRPLRALADTVFPVGDLDGVSPAVCAKAATEFTALLPPPSSTTTAAASNNNRNDRSQWLQVGFAAAKQEALEASALLLVFLHSPLHPKSKSFLNALHSVIKGSFLNEENVRAVGFSIHTAQGMQLAQFFQASAYPLLALVQSPPSTSTSSRSSSSSTGTTVNLLMRAEGPSLLEWNLDNLLGHLQASLTRHQVLVADALARRLQQAEETELRRQQDEEYQQSLQRDQQRENELQAKLQQEEREKQQKRDRFQRAQKLVQDNDASVSGGCKTAMVRFVLPSGVKLNQRFAHAQKIDVLFAYLVVYFHENDIPIERIGLSTSFPRKTLEESDPSTLEEAGLTPHAVLMVQDLDA